MMEVAYGAHELQKLKFFQYKPQNKHTLLLIHGGAWNDVANTYNDFEQMASFCAENKVMAEFNIVGINYRLTPEIQHPYHLLDVISGISFLEKQYGVNQLSMAGHSVGATMVLQLLNYRQILDAAFADMDKAKHIEVPQLYVSLNTVVFIDGIYNMRDLVAEYGGYYQTFVERAFGGEKQYTEAVQTSWAQNTQEFELSFQKAVVVQSTQDELLSLRQTHGFLAFLKQLNVEYTYYEQAWGAHEQVYRRKELALAIIAALT